jgi:hypothetical protein
MKHKEINAWILERYILNELPNSRIMEIDRQLKEDPRLKKEIERLKDSNKDILNQYPSDSIVPQILRQYNDNIEKSRKEHVTRTRSVFFKRLVYASPAFAVVLILLFLVFPFQKDNIDPTIKMTPTDSTRIKGNELTEPHLIVYRKDNENVELLKNGVKAKAGDLLQIAYESAKEKYGVILSIDGNGTVTLHYPEREDQSTVLKKGKKVLLGSSYELDNAPEFERFFFITSMSEIDVAGVIQKAKRLAQDFKRAKTGNIELIDPFKQTSVLIIK